ncbi:MAG: type II toxin-antitoxin system VapC family toxin [Thermomicrobiales bacterium]
MSSPARPRYVLDTSIAVKWYLPDEDHGQEADTLLTQFLTGQVDLIAPSHINYEMSNVMWTAVRRGRVPEELARDALVEFLSLPIDRVGGERLALEGFDVGRSYGCAAYDGLYLALASRLAIPFLHADNRLRNILASRFPNELYIEAFV